MIISYKQLFIFFAFITLTNIGFSQTKQDIQEYLKNRIEAYSNRPRTQINFSSCGLKYYFYRTLPGNLPWTQEWSSNLSNLKDVHYIRQGGYPIITLIFGADDIIVTDIEQDGSRKFVMFDKDFAFIFQKETIDDSEARKIVGYIKKLGKMCGARILDL